MCVERDWGAKRHRVERAIARAELPPHRRVQFGLQPLRPPAARAVSGPARPAGNGAARQGGRAGARLPSEAQLLLRKGELAPRGARLHHRRVVSD